MAATEDRGGPASSSGGDSRPGTKQGESEPKKRGTEQGGGTSE